MTTITTQNITDSLTINKNFVTHSAKTDTVVFNPKKEECVDTVTITKKNDIEQTDVEAEKKAKRKKRLITAGIGIATVAIGVGISYLLKKNSGNVVNNLKDLTSLNNISNIDNFDNFKNLDVVKNLAEAEKKEIFDALHKNGNINLFLGTLQGNKPMSILACNQSNGSLPNPLELIKKLDLGDNFEIIQAIKFNFSKNNTIFNSYFINKSELFKTIANNKDIYTDRLNLPINSTIEDIYNALKGQINGQTHLCDDLLGISLGFPRYDSIIFNLEGLYDLRKLRTSPDFVEKLLETLKDKNLPYRNLSPKRLSALEKAIKNINKQNLIDIGFKGSYSDGLYSFINFCDDKEELARIATASANFKKSLNIA